MYHLPRIGDQIRVLAKGLAITNPELLMLAREAAGDSKLRSIGHLEHEPARMLMETLQIIRWTKTLAQQSDTSLQLRPCRNPTLKSQQ